MTKLHEVMTYIQDWNLIKMVSDDDIKKYVRFEKEYEAREIVKGMIEMALLKENKEIDV